jgi:hypothetical protein
MNKRNLCFALLILAVVETGLTVRCIAGPVSDVPNDVKPADVSKFLRARTTVRNLYWELLRRNADEDPSGERHWIDYLLTYGEALTRETFKKQPEALGVIVKDAYYHIDGRTSDPSVNDGVDSTFGWR